MSLIDVAESSCILLSPRRDPLLFGIVRSVSFRMADIGRKKLVAPPLLFILFFAANPCRGARCVYFPLGSSTSITSKFRREKTRASSLGFLQSDLRNVLIQEFSPVLHPSKFSRICVIFWKVSFLLFFHRILHHVFTRIDETPSSICTTEFIVLRRKSMMDSASHWSGNTKLGLRSTNFIASSRLVYRAEREVALFRVTSLLSCFCFSIQTSWSRCISRHYVRQLWSSRIRFLAPSCNRVSQNQQLSK
jgi:hypothetical protein